MTMLDETTRYYAARAAVYDETAGYRDIEAERLREPIMARYRDLFRGQDVLELACGTGYWTAVVGKVARSVLAIDMHPSVIRLAEDRCRDLETVGFQVADARSLDGVPTGFTAALGVWWWSHVRREAVRTFLSALHARLDPGSLVLFNDQLPYGGRERKLDAEGNTLERRVLPDGRAFWIVKNFPSEDELRAVLRPLADDVRYRARPDERHWELTYRTR